MKRRTRRPNRMIGRYFALVALFIIALALLVQSLRPGERAPLASDDQVLYVIRGEAYSACSADAQPATLLPGERVSLARGCTVRTGAGAEAALIFDRGKLLVLLGPNAELALSAIERRAVGNMLRLSGTLIRGKATCWLEGSALDSASLLWQVGPAELYSDGGLFEAVAYDSAGARLTVHQGDVRVTLDDVVARITVGQEVGLEAGRALDALATAQEAPARPSLPADLTAAPTPHPAVAGQQATPTSAEPLALYTVRANDTLSGIAEAHGLTCKSCGMPIARPCPTLKCCWPGRPCAFPPRARTSHSPLAVAARRGAPAPPGPPDRGSRPVADSR